MNCCLQVSQQEQPMNLGRILGGGIMFKWDIWNGRSRQFKKDLKSKEGQKHEHKLK
ncbi:hypothetical protein NMV_0996 [Neisseria meningitidis 8013]|uniref:Uncharacterized protein n=3 Tax=Neisseria meningitidis TaxID=487 RepID=A0A9K2KPA3_NEIM8|nr:conserved hypothetical protein [Neisseria meningitidis 053442]ADO31834.1 hypothetical protein NMBB_1553 [Neisseria meningitidis alpha710]CAX49863.1 hypothetical protein NMV_0996 [Neisseria meningitidis 8013]CBA06557.1 hypothetical protein predicted by Glimmer/Critica [Neisseria meningitidis alpha14]CCA44385.1 hypothetical protein NMALPHA522_0844 [Neisseria meningitidis alpha522]CCI72992.1 hypothetical protein BN21_0957 [Neisseria meningitidis alpha704]